jgi:predicted transcriptional regulator
MTQSVKEILRRIENWPQEDQEELAEIARDIEARRSGVYHPTAEELEAIDEGLAQLARGEYASREEVEAAFAKFGRL